MFAMTLNGTGLLNPQACQTKERTDNDQHKALIISKRFKSTNGIRVGEQSRQDELALSLRQVAHVDGNLAKAARQLNMKRTNSTRESSDC